MNLRTPHARVFASFVLVALAIKGPAQVWSDTWFNLVLGREIVTTGLVRRNFLTQQGWGVDVVDQQWLSHVLFHASFTALGMTGVVLLASATTAAALLGAWRAAGSATPGRTLWVGTIGLAVVIAQGVARAQALALPILVMFIAVLSRDARAPARRTWWLVPLAVVWANLHGSVLLAPAMGALLGTCRPIDAWRRREPLPRQLGRDALLTASLFAAVFASPYAARLPDYYRSTFANPALRLYVNEWQAPVPAESPGPILLVALVAVLLALTFRTMSTFVGVLAALLAMATLVSVRYATPLALASICILPASVDAALGEKTLRLEPDQFLEWLSRVLPVASFIAIVVSLATVARRIEADVPASLVDGVARVAGSERLVLADEANADRLLWFHPELTGRIAHDSRAETLPPSYLEALATLYGTPSVASSQRLLDGFSAVVVDREQHPTLARWLREDPLFAPLTSDPHADAFVRISSRPADEESYSERKTR